MEKIIRKFIKGLPVRLTDWIGSTSSLVVHTFLFIGIFALRLFGTSMEEILLILTTAVSLEAIYLAIFIQLTVNRNTESLVEVEENIDEIQADVQGMGQDIDEIQEDIDKLEEDEEKEMDSYTVLSNIEKRLLDLMKDVEILKNHQQNHQITQNHQEIHK
jgi:uncharacterized protein YoxC